MRQGSAHVFFIILAALASYTTYAMLQPDQAPVAVPFPVTVPLEQGVASALPVQSFFAGAGLEERENPLAGETLYVEPDTPPARQAALWQEERPQDAARMQFLAQQPRSIWLGSWNADIERDTDRVMDAIERSGGLGVLVAYHVPSFSCEEYEKEQHRVEERYLAWMRSFAAGIGSRKVVVVLEPDALAGRECLSESAGQSLLGEAVRILKENPRAAVYIDAGHSVWNSAETMAQKLTRANIARADGFALNVSNYITTQELIDYGSRISRLVGGKHFVIDTSRNGNGPTPDFQWCNAWGRSIGELPTTDTGHPLVDAYLWVKQPGESDGTCNGGPAAGTWWPEYALSLTAP